jgi:hypothetical protein
MKRIVVYLLALMALLTYVGISTASGQLPLGLTALQLPIECGAIGGIGGCVYCLRAIYINAGVHKSWDPSWMPWYFTRPWVSVACGCVSLLFLKAGLLILEASKAPGSTNLGFYALAFIAGMNVDNFLTKLEDIAHATWGIKQSRSRSLHTDGDGTHGHRPPT